MRYLIVPAVSALLLAALPAQARPESGQFVQIAQNDSGRGHVKADRNRSDRGAKQGNSRVQADGTRGAGPGEARSRGDRSGVGRQDVTGTGRIQTGGPGPTGGAGGAATTHNRPPGSGSVTGGRPGGGAVTGAGRPSGTVFGTRPSNWNRYPHRFDANAYQRNITSSRHYHWKKYHRPNGWYYRRWVFGQIFPRIFWVRDYWLLDYWMFDLPIPPYGYVWVRYGDDALLIDRRTGRILQVVYDVFD